ncbi:MAG: ABC transporter permease subunit [Paracoccaceae bacterium]
MPDRLKIALMLAPTLCVIGVLFFGGLAVIVIRSFSYMPSLGLTEPNLVAYREVFGSEVFLSSLGLSLHIALTSTLLSLILAIAAALLLRQVRVGRAAIHFLFQLNLTVPHIVGAIGILYLFSQSGSFARAGYHAGLIGKPADFPALVFDPYAIGIILQYVWKEVPFIGVIILAQMRTIGPDYEAVARTLGATNWQRFRHVLLPLILPGALSASVIVFAFAFGAYEIPLLLGASHPVALPVLAYRTYTDVDLTSRPAAMAMAVTIAILSAGLIWAYLRIARRGLRQ